MLAPWLQKRVTEAIGQIAIRYPKSCIASESGSFYGGPKAGMRAINIPVGGTDLYTLMRKSNAHFLLSFGGGNTALQEFESRNMHIIALDHPQAAMKYGVRKQAVYIIRPDQIVGHRSSPIDLYAIRKYYVSVFR